MKPKVLVVEDDPLMANSILDALEEAGYDVVGPATALADASALARAEQFQVAVLDYDLQGEAVIPLAWTLRRKGIPFVVFSGWGSNVLNHTLPDGFLRIPKSRDFGPLLRTLKSLTKRPG